MEIFRQKPLLGTPLIKGHWGSQGLVGCWLMNEGAGTKSLDLSGNKNPLTHSANWLRNGIFVDTASDRLLVDSPVLSQEEGTFICCLNRQASWPTYGAVINIENSSNNSPHELFFFEDSAASGLKLKPNSDQDGTDFWNYGDTAGNLFTVGKDYIVAGVWKNGSRLEGYINGVLTGSLSGDKSWTSSAWTNGEQLSIGATYGVDYESNSIFKWAFAYNRALSSSEIRQLYIDPFCMFRRKPIILWAGATGVSVKDYTRGDVAAMPADDTNLENAFTSGEYTQVETDDADRVPQTAIGEYAAFLFKDKHTSQQSINIRWNGQSSLAPSDSTVYLQIYNRNTPGWETVASNNAAAANTDFDLQGQVTENLSYYFDASFWIACRVYQGTA
jgi:hypothetical protein